MAGIVGAAKGQVSFCFVPTHAEFGEYLYLVTRNCTKSFAYDLFAESLAIDRRGIDGGHTIVIGCQDGFQGIFFFCSSPHPSTDGPGAEGDGGDPEIRIAELSVFHDSSFLTFQS